MTKPLLLPEKPRLLVICVARFGDTLLITPGLAALKQRWPHAQLTVLAHPARMEVLRQLPFIDRLAPITKHRALWLGHLPGRPYDAALVYGDDAPLFAYAARVARRVIGFAGQRSGSQRESWIGVPRPQAPMHAVRERALLLQPLGVSLTDPHLQYRVSHAEAAEAEVFIAGRGWQGKRLVGFQLQSFPTKAYRDWPPHHFAELAERLLRRYADIQIVLLGGPESRELATGLARQLGGRVSSLAGDFSMRQNAALIARLALYVGVDTGPTHLAGALDVSMVAMYHCFHPGRLLAPLSHSALTVIEHPAAVATREASMADIPVELVHAASCSRLDAQ